MMNRRLWQGIGAILAISGCNSIVGVEDVEIVPGGGGAGGMGGATSSSSGGPRPCTVLADCDTPVDPCLVAACNSGICSVQPAMNATPCGNNAQCNEGVCVLMDGSSCAQPNECLSGNCIDGVCCNNLCAEPCNACDVPMQEGVCSPIVQGEDDPSAPCGVGRVCDGAGTCRRANGMDCSLDLECASDHCVDGVCCDTACDGSCEACDVAPGTCQLVQAGDPDEMGSFPTCFLPLVCSDVGDCKGDIKSVCTSSEQCASGFCADGFCCSTACDGSCESCNQPGTEGACAPVPAGLDDPTGAAQCIGATAFCDGSGKCLGEVGAPCVNDGDCASNLCNAQICTGKSGVGIVPNCGPALNEACNQTKIVPGGLYNRNNDQRYPAEVSEFSLDRFEVTVGRFRKFVDAFDQAPNQGGSKPAPGAGAHPGVDDSGWNPSWPLAVTSGDMKAKLLNCDGHYPHSWTTVADGKENLPMSCATWHEAFAFCAWDGGRMPTEAEWNYAAVGGSNQRAYPWSDPPILENITYGHAVYDCAGALPEGILTPGGCTVEDIRPVGSKSPLGDGDWDHADLAGNMYEWTRDEFAQSFFPVPCVDCFRSGQTGFVIRGGSWTATLYEARNNARGTLVASTIRQHGVGFRCARDPEPTCGNGVIDPGEYCDDNSLDPTIKTGCNKCDKIKKVVTGETHACAVTHLGKLKCWGDNAAGQLGQGTTMNITVPADWPRIPLPPVDDIALSRNRTCVLLKDGSVKCFGADEIDGRVGLLGTSSPVLQNLGDNPGEIKNLAAVGLPKAAIAIASGMFHTCAVLSDNAVRCWGSNASAQLGVGNTMNYQGPAPEIFATTVKATSISASYDSTCILTMDGNIACWGSNQWSPGFFGLLGINSVEPMRGDGANEMKANLIYTTLPVAAKPVKNIAGSGYHYCVQNDIAKTFHCWGAAGSAQLGHGDMIGWGDGIANNMANLPVSNVNFQVAQVVAGRTHTCAVSIDGNLKCFGTNLSGELGLASNEALIGETSIEMANLPVVDTGSLKVAQISLGNGSTCVLFDNHQIKCWGRNDFGQGGVLPEDVDGIGNGVMETFSTIPFVKPF